MRQQPPHRLPVSALERKFELCWLAVAGDRGPKLVREYQFNPRRRWRFDFALAAPRVAIELEGGQWSGGRHTRGAGFEADCEKYNAATLQGWYVFRLTARMVTTGWCECLVDWIQDRSPNPKLGGDDLRVLDAHTDVHLAGNTSNAQRVLGGVRELVGEPINAPMAAAFYGGAFTLGWDNRKRRLITVEARL